MMVLICSHLSSLETEMGSSSGVVVEVVVTAVFSKYFCAAVLSNELSWAANLELRDNNYRYLYGRPTPHW